MVLPRYFDLVVLCHTNLKSSARFCTNIDTQIVDLDCKCYEGKFGKLFYHEVFSQKNPLFEIIFDKDVVSPYKSGDRRELVEAEILPIDQEPRSWADRIDKHFRRVGAEISQDPRRGIRLHLS